MKKQTSLFSFLKKKSEPASSATPRILSYESLPPTPKRSSQPNAPTPSKNKKQPKMPPSIKGSRIMNMIENNNFENTILYELRKTRGSFTMQILM